VKFQSLLTAVPWLKRLVPQRRAVPWLRWLVPRGRAVPWLMQFLADFSSRRTWFGAGQYQVGFMVDKVELGLTLLRILPFSVVSIIPTSSTVNNTLTTTSGRKLENLIQSRSCFVYRGHWAERCCRHCRYVHRQLRLELRR
jgi:hypothetical protein